MKQTSTPLFLFILLSALSISTALSLLDLRQGTMRDPILGLIICLFWLASFSLAWNRWSKRSSMWLARLAACVIALIALVTVFTWVLRQDVFMVTAKSGALVAGSAWPLLWLWAIFCAAFSFAVWGGHVLIRPKTRKTILRSIWLCGLLAWTLFCGYILANNLTVDVIIHTLLGAAKAVGVLLLSLGGLFIVLFILSIPANRRQKRAEEDFNRIDITTRLGLLELIDQHARKGDFLVLYRPGEGEPNAQGLAKIGGNPRGTAGEAWPANADGSPGIFLLQLPLLAPRLPAPWQGRLLVCYLIDCELHIRSYDASVIATLIDKPNPLKETYVSAQQLYQLAIPFVPMQQGDDPSESAISPGNLFARIPGLKAAIEPLTDYPDVILGNLLAMDQAERHVEDTPVPECSIQVGGEPYLIKGPHEPMCHLCKRPMGFLFQFGDVTENIALGDCSVAYVYGCETHADEYIGFWDSY